MDYTFFIAMGVTFIVLYLILYLIPIGLWFQALVSGVRISILELIFMRWRKVPPSLIVNSMIMATKAGVSVNRDELEALYLSGGNVHNVIVSMISAQKAGGNLNFKDAVNKEFNTIDIQQIIEKYQLQPHPEGGYFREVYRSEQHVKSPISRKDRNAVTHIYFLLKKGQKSRFHKVLHDEIWNFYEGSPLKLIEYNGSKVEETIIGKNDYFAVIKGGDYQAAESTGEYSLVGCSVAPGFDFKDFSFFESEPQILSKFKQEFPDFECLT